jgi:hypothetical protein
MAKGGGKKKNYFFKFKLIARDELVSLRGITQLEGQRHR